MSEINENCHFRGNTRKYQRGFLGDGDDNENNDAEETTKKETLDDDDDDL